ncbi:hypothetical protein J2046_004163 [Rhizobium petrolearium]|uniref:hypothetical protein n=1 Tax=Neorhizobium petrolearium TaxID=515361 RepID=UPI001AE979B4|nr:hypothetical protein [Neorhizobium petrolearium]MBP1845889.1 hypothetical protein [Neorhizobium petrolearium]
MATARIYMIHCVRHSSGTDFSTSQALSGLAGEVFASEFVDPLLEAIKALPAVIAAIDTARDDPDNLFMTFGSDDISEAFWPGAGQYTDLQAGMSAEILLDFSVDYSQNVSLWDYDNPSGNDHMGSVTLYASEAGQGEKAKLAKNEVEGSAYYVLYEVLA